MRRPGGRQGLVRPRSGPASCPTPPRPSPGGRRGPGSALLRDAMRGLRVGPTPPAPAPPSSPSPRPRGLRRPRPPVGRGSRLPPEAVTPSRVSPACRHGLGGVGGRGGAALGPPLGARGSGGANGPARPRRHQRLCLPGSLRCPGRRDAGSGALRGARPQPEQGLRALPVLATPAAFPSPFPFLVHSLTGPFSGRETLARNSC